MERLPSSGLVLAAGLVLSACVSADVQEEVSILGEASAEVSDRTLKALAPQIAAFEAQEPERAAANQDLWILSEACSKTQEVFNYDALQDCDVVKIRNEASNVLPTQIQAIERKLGGLAEYMTLLADLASASTEAEVKLAFGALSGSLDNLGKATGSSGVSSASALISDNKEKIDAVVDASVSALRARYLRQTVKEAHPLIVQIAGELKAGLQAIDFDPAYSLAVANLRAAEVEALDATASTDVARTGAAYRALETRHEAFLKAAEASVYNELDQVVAAHAGLRARLRARPSPEELKGYVRALKDLKKTLEG